MTIEEAKVQAEDAFAREQNHTPHAYIDITDDLVAGTLLSQIMYWFSLNPNRKRRVKIFKDGYYWLAKRREDWYDEIRISPKQYDRAINILIKKGLVCSKVYRFGANPTTHIRPLSDNINNAIKEWKIQKQNIILKLEENNIDQTDMQSEWEMEIDQRGSSEIDQRGISNYTKGEVHKQSIHTENTTEDTISNTPANPENSKSKTIDDDEFEKEFDDLWKLYPNKKGKENAKSAYISARRKKKVSFDVVANGIQNYVKQIKARATPINYIKHGDTWFRGSCWNDEYDIRPNYINNNYSCQHEQDPNATNNVFLKILMDKEAQEGNNNDL